MSILPFWNWAKNFDQNSKSWMRPYNPQFWITVEYPPLHDEDDKDYQDYLVSGSDWRVGMGWENPLNYFRGKIVDVRYAP